MTGPSAERLPRGVAESWRERLAAPAPPTRDAATIALLRDGAAGLEVYLLRRVESMAFAAKMHVFPGGRVDPADATHHTAWYGPDPQEWAGILTADPGLARGLVCAAVRETFEEAGVLLAGASTDDVVDVSGPAWEAERLELLAHRESLSSLLERSGLGVRADLLRPWAHWITPEVEPRRYDTRFFVAGLPASQATRDVGGEADATMWLTPAEAVRLHESGELEMLPPTITTLRELAEYSNVAEVMAAAEARDIAPILPRVVFTGGDGDEAVSLVMPHEDGYEEGWLS